MSKPLTASDIQYMKEHANDSKKTEMITTTVVCGVAAFTAIGLRVFARRLAHIEFKADDWWMFASLVNQYPIIQTPKKD